MGGNSKGSFRIFLTLGILLAVSLAEASAGGMTPIQGKQGARPRANPTTEPAPPLSLNIRLVNLQKNVSGGVASIALDTSAAVNLDEVTLSVSLPANVSFTDGTQSKSWNFRVAPGGTSSIPADLLVSTDGKFVVSAQAIATLQGKTIHRGMAFKLLVGVQEKLPPAKDGAIEYQGTPGGGI